VPVQNVELKTKTLSDLCWRFDYFYALFRAESEQNSSHRYAAQFISTAAEAYNNQVLVVRFSAIKSIID
jgi:hypothetical protein